MQVEPIEAATLGARVTGVDLAKLDEDGFARIEEAWHTHAVLVFPGQHLSDDAQVDFSRRFGQLERLITAKAPDPRIGVLSNVLPDGSLLEPGGGYALFLLGNTFWHTDSSYKRIPAKASLLSARVVPSEGGETEWADMRAGWDALDPQMQDWLSERSAVHSYHYSQGLIGGTDVLSDAEWEALPPVSHPVVRVHPATGRKNLYIGRHASHLLGEDEGGSRALLEKLTAEAAASPRTFRHAWVEGDIAIWDNRCVLHRGHVWPADQARVMARTTVAGDAAANEWGL